jgi:hypothetical protein
LEQNLRHNPSSPDDALKGAPLRQALTIAPARRKGWAPDNLAVFAGCLRYKVNNRVCRRDQSLPHLLNSSWQEELVLNRSRYKRCQIAVSWVLGSLQHNNPGYRRR